MTYTEMRWPWHLLKKLEEKFNAMVQSGQTYQMPGLGIIRPGKKA
jgi:hypothetical protein